MHVLVISSCNLPPSMTFEITHNPKLGLSFHSKVINSVQDGEPGDVATALSPPSYHAAYFPPPSYHAAIVSPPPHHAAIVDCCYV